MMAAVTALAALGAGSGNGYAAVPRGASPQITGTLKHTGSTLRKNQTGMTRREWRAATKAERRQAKRGME